MDEGRVDGEVGARAEGSDGAEEDGGRGGRGGCQGESNLLRAKSRPGLGHCRLELATVG